MALQVFCVLLVAIISLDSVHSHVNDQRFAPGVPPPQQQQVHQHQPPPQQQQQQQQYQQGQHQQQQQGQQQQQQQQQYQQGQQQQQYQQGQVNQMNQQQQPPSGGHGHGHQQGDTLKFSSDIHNAEHVMEHLENVIETKPKDQMTEEELEFHYFKMHDYDNNNKLDGVEIGKALTHFHADEEDSGPTSTPPPPRKIFSDEEIANIVDVVLKENDINEDGYIEYVEFKQAQKKSKNAPPAEQPQQ